MSKIMPPPTQCSETTDPGDFISDPQCSETTDPGDFISERLNLFMYIRIMNDAEASDESILKNQEKKCYCICCGIGL
jgi:hypothetical protein